MLLPKRYTLDNTYFGKDALNLIEDIDKSFKHGKQGKALKGDHKGLFSLRIGTYRIIYTYNSNNILILKIGHRKDVYK